MGEMSLRAAKDWLRDQVFEGGAQCPCCGQYAKVYKRQINAGMARSLILMYRAGQEVEGGWVYVPRVAGSRSREEGKLAYWGLVEESDEPREDGGRAGWWRVTGLGKAFVRDRHRVQKYALVYDGRVLGFEGPQIGILDALKTRFRYDELMLGTEAVTWW